ncbi:hypothetical protein OROGR_025123 [Orobanche gracilis]
MAAVSVQQFAQCITCHAWSPDHSMIAFCPNNTEVHIYTLLGGKWEKIHVLQKDMYEGASTSVRTNVGRTEEFPITIGVHQGSALSPFLFAIVMDELTRGIQNDVPWCMMFADDIVLIDETKVGVQQKLELWRDTLEARGFRLIRSKTEYMECRFSDNSEAGMITFDEKVVHGSTFFRYLGYIIQKDGELDGDVAHRIKAGWLKWKSATGVLCDPHMPHRLKGKFYRTAIRPTLLYGTECWTVKQCHVQKMNVAEMRMLRWMCGHTKKDRLRNEVIREKHDQIVSGIDWGISSNRIVSVSHDRNSYVWSQEASEWVPTLVILRLNRAALCVQWSPKENKFSVGSGAKTVCICYYEQENNWWVSKIIRKRHDSSVTSVAWHPDNILVATTSTDGKCRVFSTFIKGVDIKNSTGSSDSKFGEQIMQLDLSISWTFGMKWSPSGNTLAYVGHNSMIYFVDDVGPSPSAQSVAFRDLPLRDVLFASERMLIGVGFDCNPMVFTADERGLWSFFRFLDEKKPASGAKYGSHSIVPLKDEGDTTITSFSTSGLDGKVIIWDLQKQHDLLEYL